MYAFMCVCVCVRETGSNKNNSVERRECEEGGVSDEKQEEGRRERTKTLTDPRTGPQGGNRERREEQAEKRRMETEPCV